jgi:diguanylate cyclase (GGDEF)-like protein
VLVVDDHPALRSLLRRVLRDYDVREAGDVASALEAVRSGPVDVVLLELRLPDGSGLDLLRRLSGDRTAPAVVVLSGVDDESTRVEALALGAEDYLCKPFAFAELRLRLGKVLARRAREAALLGRIADLEGEPVDALTGCGTGEAFDRALAQLWTERVPAGGQVAVVLLDVDDLGGVNTEWGRPAGDRVLAAVAERVRDSCRRDERVYRVGGDEFAALLAADARESYLAARRFHAQVRAARIPGSGEGRLVTVSAGVAAGPSTLVLRAAELVAAANRALSIAKRRGDTVLQGGRPATRR